MTLWLIFSNTYITCASGQLARDFSVIADINYGVVLRKVASVDIVTETWKDTYVTDLPPAPTRLVQRRGLA